MRILCLDIGTKRIGVAVSDPLGWTAQPVSVFKRRGGVRDLEAIASLCRKLAAEHIVIGIPLNEEGGVGVQAAKVKAFAERVEAHLKSSGIEVLVEMWDERYSTAIAEERLIGANVSRARRKEVIDKMAAVAILEDYLRAHEAPAAEGNEG
ncbi:MAG: Holliday junction resolvase RuvX [Pseudomonadota bacterium]